MNKKILFAVAVLVFVVVAAGVGFKLGYDSKKIEVFGISIKEASLTPDGNIVLLKENGEIISLPSITAEVFGVKDAGVTSKGDIIMLKKNGEVHYLPKKK